MVINKHDHRLYHDDGRPYPFVTTPNYSKKRQVLPEYLVMHYTTGTTVQGVIAWFKNPDSAVSAHLLIGRDGSITQFVPFDKVAWHAGVSKWRDRANLNNYSIGIELDNVGFVHRQGNQWGRGSIMLPDDAVLEATHKAQTKPRGWHRYTEAQLAVALEVSRLLFQEYGLIDVVGHDDISPGNKMDPGPAFPMEEFRAQVLGRGNP